MLHRIQQAIVAATATAIVVLSGCGGLADDPPAQGARVNTSPAATVPASSQATFTSEQRAAPPMSAAVDVSLAEQVALLRREVASLRLQVAHLPGAGQASLDRPDARNDAQAQAEAEQAERLRVATAESAFRNEPEDFRSSKGTVENVRGVFQQGGGASHDELRSVECRSRSCRVELNADAAGGGGADLPGRLLLLADTLPNVTAGQIDQGDGRKATVLYLSR